MNKLIITKNINGYDVKDSSAHIEALFIGKSFEEAQKQIGQIFTICAQAHKAAFQAASGREVTAQWQSDYQKALLWRLCIDWPRFLNQPPCASVLKNFIHKKNTYKESLSALFNGRKKWACDIYKYNAAVFEIFTQAQTEQGEFFADECGAHIKYNLDFPPLLKRFMGQVYDSFFYQEYDFSIKTSCLGEAYVPTARGFLHYKLSYKDEKITQCQISSPTHIHFNPLGAFAQRGLENKNIPISQLRLEVLGLDPCKEWEVK